MCISISSNAIILWNALGIIEIPWLTSFQDYALKLQSLTTHTGNYSVAHHIMT